MRVFALSDPHLSSVHPKPMDIFGDNWRQHDKQIADNWRQVVSDDDVVLVPGDISWAMRMQDALPDLELLGSLPGRKILLRGNHDYWWSSISKVRAMLPDGMFALQNDALVLGDFVFYGARGWRVPGQRPARYDADPAKAKGGTGEGSGPPAKGGHHGAADDEKIYRRELERMKLSIQQMEKARKDLGDRARLICLTHFPAVLPRAQRTEASDLIEGSGAEASVYGHLHGPDCKRAFRGEHGGVRYIFAAADAIEFTPVLVAQ